MQSADTAQFLGESATASAAIAMVQRASRGTADHAALAPLRGVLGRPSTKPTHADGFDDGSATHTRSMNVSHEKSYLHYNNGLSHGDPAWLMRKIARCLPRRTRKKEGAKRTKRETVVPAHKVPPSVPAMPAFLQSLGFQVLQQQQSQVSAAARAQTIDVTAKVATSQRRDTTSSNSWSW
jgi:hypothetical protein